MRLYAKAAVCCDSSFNTLTMTSEVTCPHLSDAGIEPNCEDYVEVKVRGQAGLPRGHGL